MNKAFWIAVATFFLGAATTILIVLLLGGCSCDMRGIAGEPCKIDVNGWQEGSPEYAADKAKWRAQYDSGQISWAQYQRDLGE